MEEYELLPVLERASLQDYERLFNIVYGPSEKLKLRYLEWLYKLNPAGAAVGFDAYLGGELAAHYVTVPRSCSLGGRKFKFLLSVNTATHPSHQRRGLFKKTAIKTYDFARTQGYDAVVGVANAQSIHAFTTSLGFDRIGHVSLVFRGKAGCAELEDGLSIDRSAQWVQWRLSQPGNEYWLARNASDFYVFTRVKGFDTCLGRISAEQAADSALPVKRFQSPLYFTPRFPVSRSDIRVPKKIVPSPWHVIYKPLSDRVSSTDVLKLTFDGLSMDTF